MPISLHLLHLKNNLQVSHSSTTSHQRSPRGHPRPSLLEPNPPTQQPAKPPPSSLLRLLMLLKRLHPLSEGTLQVLPIKAFHNIPEVFHIRALHHVQERKKVEQYGVLLGARAVFVSLPAGDFDAVVGL